MRLIDLHVDWLLQYAAESSVFDPARYPGVEARIDQVAGYLQATEAAILSCYRDAGEWASRPDPWSSLGELIARIEAEFPGRILIGPDDFERWEADPDGLTWALIGIEGFDALIRTEADLDQIPRLFARGVRLFQPVYTASSQLAGSSAPGDERGLTGLGRAFLERLSDVGPAGPGPRPIFDLAHMNHQASDEALSWFEGDASRPRRILPVYSHGTPAHRDFDGPRALPLDHLKRLRALGGHVGIGISPPFFRSSDPIREMIETVASSPFEGRPGIEGIGIGTDFLGVNATLPGLANAPEVIAWVEANFDRETAGSLLRGNARRLFARACGVNP